MHKFLLTLLIFLSFNVSAKNSLDGIGSAYEILPDSFKTSPDFIAGQNGVGQFVCASSKSINKPPYFAPLNVYKNPGDSKPIKVDQSGMYNVYEKKGAWLKLAADGNSSQILGWAKALDVSPLALRNCSF